MSTDRIVVVTGGRDLHPDHEDAWWVRAWLLFYGCTLLVHGKGPHRCDDLRCKRDSLDCWAGRVAHRLRIRVQECPAQGREPEAFTRRNLAMLDLGPVAVLALPGKRGAEHRPGSGTGHTVHHARARGIEVRLRGDDQWPPEPGEKTT